MPAMRSPVEKAIWFIESHFAEEITLDDVAGVCGLSRFQTSRLFGTTSAQTMTGYLRGRRLTEAARALVDGAPDILAVAIEAGYGSHEAFTRAFTQQFGATPSQVRDRGRLDGLALVEPMREDPDVTGRLPPPAIGRHGELHLAGVGRRFPVDDLAGIPSLWQDLRAYDDAIPVSDLDVALPQLDQAGLKGTFFLMGKAMRPEDVPRISRLVTEAFRDAPHTDWQSPAARALLAAARQLSADLGHRHTGPAT